MPDSEVAEGNPPVDTNIIPPRRSKSMRIIIPLAVVTGLLTSLDGAATWYEVEVLKVAEEANPFLQAVESALGFTGAMVFRVLGGIALLIGVVSAARRSRERVRHLIIAGLFLACIFYALLDTFHWMILWNFKHMMT
jgi:uncharacterized membrane protein YozB (DUF420 family)